MQVEAALEPLEIPTYPVAAPEKNPVFFEKRVYQGSNGKVYPLPFIDKVHDEPVPVTYQSARLENEFIRLVMLPEIGGRIFLGQDKSNGDYDFFYRQPYTTPNFQDTILGLYFKCFCCPLKTFMIFHLI